MVKHYIRIVETAVQFCPGPKLIMDPKELEILGEKIATDYLKKKGYQILDKNYSPHHISGPKRGEIDMVVKKGDIISFLKVKTLRDPPR